MNINGTNKRRHHRIAIPAQAAATRPTIRPEYQPNAKALPATVKALRIEKNLTISGLAKKCGLTLSTVSAIESGKRPNPGADTLIALATGLRVTLNTLLSFDLCALAPRPITTIEELAHETDMLQTRVDALERTSAPSRTPASFASEPRHDASPIGIFGRK